MHDEHTPRHRRGLPADLDLSAEEERELMDLRTDLDRDRRRRESERDPETPEPWDFPVPRAVARLFDALPSPFSIQRAVDEGEALGIDAGDVVEALREMRARELVSDAPEGYVKHPEAKGWF